MVPNQFLAEGGGSGNQDMPEFVPTHLYGGFRDRRARRHRYGIRARPVLDKHGAAIFLCVRR